MILKNKLSIKSIGIQYFSFGILIGVLYYLILMIFISYSRELFILSTLSYERDLFRLDDKSYYWIDMIISFINIVCAFGITLIIWCIGLFRRNVNKKPRYILYSNLAFLAFVVFVTYSISYRVITLSSFFSVTLGIHEIILKYFDIRLFIIAPFVIFFTLWLKIQIYYKSYIWIFISFAILLVTGFVFGINFPIDRDIIRNTYNEKFVEEYNYIDENLKLLYPKKDTNYTYYHEILRTKQSNEIHELLIDSKTAFQNNESISIDTLIFQKILIHNLNGEYFYCYSRKKDCWLYAHPNDIYRLINNEDINSRKIEILFQILELQIDYLNHYESLHFPIKIKDNEEISYYIERKKQMSFNLFRYRARHIVFDLATVREKLIKDKRFEFYHKYLPEIKIDLKEFN
jgi:hypothetical protein